MFEWMNENNKKKVINKLCVCKLIANNIISFFYLSGTEIDCTSWVRLQCRNTLQCHSEYLPL